MIVTYQNFLPFLPLGVIKGNLEAYELLSTYIDPFEDLIEEAIATCNLYELEPCLIAKPTPDRGLIIYSTSLILFEENFPGVATEQVCDLARFCVEDFKKQTQQGIIPLLVEFPWTYGILGIVDEAIAPHEYYLDDSSSFLQNANQQAG